MQNNDPETAGNSNISCDVKEEFSLMFVGDTAFGENYQEVIENKGGENILKSRGYHSSLIEMAPLLNKADMVLANLETPLTDIEESPFKYIKSWVHRGDKKETPANLLKHNIKLVTLANNHTFDYGRSGFEDTIATLELSGIKYVGAGLDDATSRGPLMIEFRFSNGTKRTLAIFSGYQWSRKAQETFNLFAGNGEGGINPMRPENLKKQISKLRKADKEITIIVFPHWGRNYQWASPSQRKTAAVLLNAEADLIIGHGAHMMQEIEKIGNKWAIFSIGNFIFNSPGRYAKFQAPPFSFVAELISRSALQSRPSMKLRLYPIVTNNRITDYQTRCVSEKEFKQVCDHLNSRSESHFKELKPSAVKIEDKARYCLELDI